VVTHGRSYIVILVCFGMELAHFYSLLWTSDDIILQMHALNVDCFEH
jgi:hypothetical protein